MDVSLTVVVLELVGSSKRFAFGCRRSGGHDWIRNWPGRRWSVGCAISRQENDWVLKKAKMTFASAPNERGFDGDEVCIELTAPNLDSAVGWFFVNSGENLVGHQREDIVARHVGSYHCGVFWWASWFPSRVECGLLPEWYYFFLVHYSVVTY